MGKTNLTLDGFHLDVVRPDDLVVLTFRFANMTLDDDRGARLRPGAGALIVVDFPPQAFAEQAFTELDSEPTPPAPPGTPGEVAVRIARKARLVFEIPSGEVIPYTLEGILGACGKARLRTGRRASGGLFPPSPGVDHTAIEIPYGLRMSPSPTSGWAHATGSVFGKGSFELWHTRLGELREADGEPVVVEPGTTAGGPPPATSVRAAWPGSDDVDLVGTLDDTTRGDLVTFGNDRKLPEIRVGRLMLSSLGGWLEAHWGPLDVPGTAVQEWEHRMTMGRDHYVTVLQKGRLFPYGHRASVFEVTERRFHRDRTAYLRRVTQLFVQEPEVAYGDLGMPFGRVRVLNRSTPRLMDRRSPESRLVEGAFWPMVSPRDDFLFTLVVTDRGGRDIGITTPLVFVAEGTRPAAVVSAYEKAREQRRVRPLTGEPVTYAVASPSQPSDSTFETDTIELTAKEVAPTSPSAPPFVPQLRNAVASIPAVRNLTGKEKVAFTYHGDYKGGRTHPLDVFAVLTDPTQGQVTFSPATSGGVTTPDMNMTSISRTLGPVGGSRVDGGVFQPAEFFSGTAKLFGIVPLAEILGEVTSLTAGTDFPKVADPFGGGEQEVPVIPKLVCEGPDRTRLVWSTGELRPWAPKGTAVFEPVPSAARLWIEVVRDGGTAATRCELTNFNVVLPLLRVPFESFRFAAETGKKVDLSVRLGTVAFTGALSFVNKLAELIPAGGFVDPPAIEVTDAGVKAGYTLAVPAAPFAIFNLQNLALAAFAHLPLVAQPGQQMRVGFQVSERHNPFLVTVSAFGGAGFFALEAGLGGISVLEASLEFGGALALSIGVASGGVTLMAGIYYANVEGNSALSGFVRVNGVLEVLGIVSISAQFYLQLQWNESPRKVWGTATVTVKVKIAFFSESVSMSVTREFAGSPAPSFAELTPPAAWRQYCEAFATE